VAAGLVLAVTAGCAPARNATTAPSPTTAPTPTPTELAPLPSDTASTFAPEPKTAGEPVDCTLLPVQGSLIVTYAAHDCWMVRHNTTGNPDEVFLGGVDPDDKTVGVVMFARFDVPDENLVKVRLPGHGDVTLTLGRATFACVRAHDGTRWTFSVATKALTAPRPGDRCAR
jgi:hypothetical protein